MVLFSLLGVIALLQRERKKVNSTHSGQEENPGQSDVPPVRSCDGKLYKCSCYGNMQHRSTWKLSSCLKFMFSCIYTNNEMHYPD